MRRFIVALGLGLAGPVWAADEAPPIGISSPGLAASQMDAAGRLIEDWGTVGVQLQGESVVAGSVKTEAIQLDGVIPAARATAEYGSVRLVLTAYRAPVFPSGLDVLTARLEEARSQPARITVGLELPEGSQRGLRTVKLGGRTVLTLPSESAAEQPLREWGYCDEATALPGWARPDGPCDPAFRNIRAGLGGVPIVYRFRVPPKSRVNVVLGFCESHWAEAGQRPLNCRVEGDAAQIVDPISAWGRHKPGAILFRGRDLNGDGTLEITVRAAAGAPDRNPILNVIWVFRGGEPPPLDEVIAGQRSVSAIHYVDVGGENDQSLFPPGNWECRVELPAGGSREMTFYVACQGDSAPIPDATAWTADSLRRAAREVWRDWKGAGRVE